MRKSIRKSTLAMKIVPVLAASAFKNKGIQPLLDAVVDYLPSPVDVPPVEGINPENDEPILRRAADDQPFSALAFKIMSDPFVGHVTYIRAYSGMLKAGSYIYNSTKGSRERIGRLLQMHANKREEIDVVYAGDICACVGLKSVTTGDTLCDENKQIILEAIDLPAPVISVAVVPKTKQDALGKSVAGAGGKWKFDKEHRFLFVDKIFGGAIPKEFIPPIEVGIREAMDSGPLAGFMMVDVAAVLVDGSYHDVDSSEMAFKIAGSMGFKEACARAKPVLLEPIMKVEVVVPEEYMAAVFGDLNSRRAQIQGSEVRAGSHVIRVQVPLAGMFGYATDLRSRTQGRGNFTMHFSHYAEVPGGLGEEIIGKVRGKK